MRRPGPGSTEAPVLLAAGGTGGHLFPAEALARALAARGVPTELMTDSRGLAYGATFPARACHSVPSATPTGASAASKLQSAATLGRGTMKALASISRINPAVVVGFGGYPTVPPVLAAAMRGIPIVLHEQNAVMGRANRFVAGRAAAIATGFPSLGKASDAIRAKISFTGNPVRPAVFVAAADPYPALEPGGSFRLLVTGGSQGARVMSEVVPAAIEQLDEGSRARLVIVQQARGEDEARVREAYARLGVTATVASFFTDLPARIGAAHLVIARSGASTVSELATIGRPAILVPFPHALDQDQAANAATLADSGAAVVCDQARFTPDWLAVELVRAMSMGAELRQRAQSAQLAARPDAAERLADLVLEVAGRPRRGAAR